MINYQMYTPFLNIVKYPSSFHRQQDCLVVDNKVEIGEKLDSTQHVVCNYGGVPMYEIDINATITDTSKFNVSYQEGEVFFDESMENQIINISWYATHKIRYKASSVSIDDTSHLYQSDNVEDALREVAESVTNNNNDITSQINVVNNNVNNIISYNAGGAKDPELINARTDSNGIIQQTLKQSMDSNYTANLNKIGDLTGNGITEASLALAVKNDRSQLAAIVQQTTDLETNKTDKTYTDSQDALKANQVDVRLKAIPLEQVDLSDTLKAQIAGTAGVNVTPQNIGVTRTKMALNAVGYYNTDYLAIGKNLFNKYTATSGYWVNYTNGNFEAVSNYYVSDYIPVQPSTQYSRKINNSINYYDNQYNRISGALNSGLTFTTPSNCAFIRINISGSGTANRDAEQLELGATSTTYESYGVKFTTPFIDTLASMDVYPFQPLDTFTNTTIAKEIRNAVKKIEIYGADLTKKYCLGIIQRNYSTYGTGAYLYECDFITGATTKIVAMTSIKSYTEPLGIDAFNLAQYNSSGITAKIWVDWTQITAGNQYINTNYSLSGLDVRTYISNPTYIPENISINLPSKLYTVIGDTLEIFYKGIIRAVNPYNYNIKVVSAKGNAYSKRYIYTPVVGDTDFTITFSVYDNGNNLLATKIVTVVVSQVKSNPTSIKNVLCVSDSLLTNGTWAAEMKRRIADIGGNPVGNGLSNIKFIGSLTSSSDVNVGYEGYGGWAWENYNSNSTPPKYWVTVTSGMKTDVISQESIWSDGTNQWQLETLDIPNNKIKFKQYPIGSAWVIPTSGALTFVSGSGDTTSIVYNAITAEAGNPFWNISTGKLDFINYCTKIVAAQIDYCYILLGWNDIYDTIDQIKIEAKKLIDQLHVDYPNCKIALCGLEVPSLDGLGANYGANTNWNYYEKLQYVFNLNDAYYAISQDSSYSSFVDFVNISSQVDVENNMLTGTRPVNVRNATTEVYGINGVHLATSGYYQIADANYRHIMSKL